MIYFTNPTRKAAAAMLAGRLGFIDTPLQGNKRPPGVIWCADNGCFNDATFNERRWFGWLSKNNPHRCVFAVAPDVFGDAAATLTRSRPWLPRIRELGYPVAYVAQDGIEHTAIPWNQFDALFIGGTNTFKDGAHARQVAREAKHRGKWVHVGRVNSRRRFRIAADILHADSCDGTYITFGPDTNLPKLLSWIDHAERRPALDLDIR